MLDSPFSFTLSPLINKGLVNSIPTFANSLTSFTLNLGNSEIGGNGSDLPLCFLHILQLNITCFYLLPSL